MVLHSKILNGTNRHLLILHGVFGMGDNWGSLGKEFSNKFTTHLVDLRNHGRSFKVEEMSYELMADDLFNYIKHHNLEKINLLGHSMGGIVAMHFAVKYPSLLNKLIIADIAPKNYPPHHTSIFKALESVDFSTIETRKQVDEALSENIKEWGVRQFLLKNVYRTPTGAFDFRFNLKAIKSNYKNMMDNADIQEKKYSGDTLFLRGELSNYIELPNDEIIIKQKFTNSSLITIKKAGHWLHAENPKDFLKICINYMNNS